VTGNLVSSWCFLSQLVFKLKPFAGAKRSPHIFDVTCQQGLLDMISLGCLIEFSRALDDRLYRKIEESIPQDEDDEIDAAQTRYRRFITWYQERFFIIIDGEWINPSYIFSRRLVDFASTIVLYVKEQVKDFHKAPMEKHTLTVLSITKHLLTHFRGGWPDLAEAFFEVKKHPSHRLYYEGPAIQIVARKPDWRQQFAALRLKERDEWSGAPLEALALKALYEGPIHVSSDEDEEELEDADEDDEDEDDEDDEDEDEDGGASSDSSSSLSGMSTDFHAPTGATTAAPSTPPPHGKRSRPSPSSTPNQSPSSTRLAKRQR
jgi:hypothetical protein